MNKNKKNAQIILIIILLLWAVALPIFTYKNPSIREVMMWVAPIGAIIIALPYVIYYSRKNSSLILRVIRSIFILCLVGIFWLVAYLIATFNSVN